VDAGHAHSGGQGQLQAFLVAAQRSWVGHALDTRLSRNVSATAPVPGTRSENKSLDSVKLSPLAMGRTVRRVRTWVAGFTDSA